MKGISHVALGVSDMDRSLPFYRDLLGLEVMLDAVETVGRGKRTSGCPAELQNHLGRDRRLAHTSAYAVGAEVVSLRHEVASFPFSIAHQTFSASTVSLTS